MLAATPEAWADEAIRRSGLLAVFGELQRVGDQIPGVQDAINFAGQPPRSTFGRDPFTEALGPTLGIAKELGKITTRGNADTAISSTRNLIPLQNHFLLSLIFDRAENYLKEKF